MKKISRLGFASLLILTLSGCGEQLKTSVDEIQNQAKQKVEEVKTSANKAKSNVEQTIEDVQKAKEEMDKTVDQLNATADAVKEAVSAGE